jgi:hypothetical protein
MKNEEKIEFHYLKSPDFKSFYATGAYGGISPNGLISMAYYVERSPIPRKTVYNLEENGKIGKELTELVESKNGIIREVDCNILFDIGTARNIRSWLDNHIKILEELEKKQIE